MIYSLFHYGVNASKLQQQGFFGLKNCDISYLGLVSANQALFKASGATVDKPCIGVTAGDGTVYLLSKTDGSIFKRTTGGTYSLDHTNANGAHSGGGWFNNRLWFASSNKLGYNASGSYTDTFGTFLSSTSTKPFLRTGVNRAFAYFGDGAQVASINKDNLFNDNALDIPIDEIVTDLEEWGNDIVIASYISGNVQVSKLYRWNQYQSTYYNPDTLRKAGISALIPSDNSNVLFALSEDELYSYTGTALEPYKLLQVSASLNPYNKTVLQGIPYFAIGDTVYAIYQVERGMPFAIVPAFTCSQEGATIESLCSTANTLIVSWSYSGTYGVDEIDTDKATAEVVTPMFTSKQADGSVYKPTTVYAYYDSIPLGTSLSLELDINGDGFVAHDFINEPENKRYALSGGFKAQNVNDIKAKVILNPNGTSSPSVTAIEII